MLVALVVAYRKAFMKDSLSEKERIALAELRHVDETTVWGAGIKEVIDSDDTEKFRELIKNLKSQAIDNPALMLVILGKYCFEAVMEL